MRVSRSATFGCLRSLDYSSPVFWATLPFCHAVCGRQNNSCSGIQSADETQRNQGFLFILPGVFYHLQGMR